MSTEVLTDRSGLKAIREKVERGERLTREDGITLYEHPDLSAVGALANEVASERHGLDVGYNVNRHINYSNLCKLSCMFCSFSKKLVDEKGIGYEFSMEEILGRAKEAAEAGADELHIVGGLHPGYPYSYYPEMLQSIRDLYPRLHLKAFTAVEIDYFAELAGRDIEWVLNDLRDHGLGSMPGGGAEVLSDRVHMKLFRDKMPPSRWLEVHETAHRMGIRTNSTLLYGHIERVDEKVDHLIQLRESQDRVDGFMTFIPLRYHNEYNRLQNLPMVRAVHSLREIAVGRLMFDNVPHVKAYWIMMGLETAQLCLQYGANDVDGTVVEEKITHMAGAKTPEGVTEEQLRDLIRQAGRNPVRRDTLYNRVETPSS
ncbi:MAG: aminofutalosine synthase MqnE [Planctomycetota bacterium]|jgi:aminodeoxyfutalosine synthase